MTTLSKIECTRRVATGELVETFHHETLGIFDITALREKIRTINKRQPMILRHCRYDSVQMVDGIKCDATEYLFSNREIDKARAAMLTKRQIDDPLIFLLCPAGTNGMGESHLLVDGIHRMFERRRRGYKHFEFYLFPFAYAPRVDPEAVSEIKWGEKDLVPGVGLVARKRE